MPQGAELSHLSGWIHNTDYSSYGLAVLAVPDGCEMTRSSSLQLPLEVWTHDASSLIVRFLVSKLNRGSYLVVILIITWHLVS